MLSIIYNNNLVIQQHIYQINDIFYNVHLLPGISDDDMMDIIDDKYEDKIDESVECLSLVDENGHHIAQLELISPTNEEIKLRGLISLII